MLLQSVRYENGTDGWDNFVKSQSAIYMEIWVFNLTNAEDVLADSNYSIPHVEQIGPYTYL